jgi:hypothetical protein
MGGVGWRVIIEGRHRKGWGDPKMKKGRVNPNAIVPICSYFSTPVPYAPTLKSV